MFNEEREQQTESPCNHLNEETKTRGNCIFFPSFAKIRRNDEKRKSFMTFFLQSIPNWMGLRMWREWWKRPLKCVRRVRTTHAQSNHLKVHFSHKRCSDCRRHWWRMHFAFEYCFSLRSVDALGPILCTANHVVGAKCEWSFMASRKMRNKFDDGRK